MSQERIDELNWLNPLISAQMSIQEQSLRKHAPGTGEVLMLMKDTLHSIFHRSAGTQGGAMRRVFALCDKGESASYDTIIFVNAIRMDLPMHSVLCDGYVLTLTPQIMERIWPPWQELVESDQVCSLTLYDGERRGWKHLLPALVERCRTNWKHTATCEYGLGTIPLSENTLSDPLCSCGRGKDVEGMYEVESWRPFAPHVTRLAFSPLFSVSYLEAVIRDPTRWRCHLCRGKGKPKIMECGGCRKVRYCSKDCAKKDWAKHKSRCIK